MGLTVSCAFDNGCGINTSVVPDRFNQPARQGRPAKAGIRGDGNGMDGETGGRVPRTATSQHGPAPARPPHHTSQ
jgi:hypothetical protein